ncbi:GatB/YqeY domain-containing protein [Candidatus Peregrinibacteria bacterium]|nr:GatB/YqeY domain-containing protein [Candidatus Peregrinibacteria bacterium]
MSLKDQIQKDMIGAMKAKEDIKLNALRMLKAEIMKFEVAGSEKKEAKDEDVIQLIGKQVKQRDDAATQYKAGNRPELAEKEEKEAEILKKYLPAQMSEEEVKKIVQETIKEVGATGKADLGKVMGAIMPKVKGKADGKLINKIVQDLLI